MRDPHRVVFPGTFPRPSGYAGGIDSGSPCPNRRGIKNARYRKQVTPGDVLTLHCELVEQRGPVGIGKATAWVDGVRAANAELTFVITDA